MLKRPLREMSRQIPLILDDGSDLIQIRAEMLCRDGFQLEQRRTGGMAQREQAVFVQHIVHKGAGLLSSRPRCRWRIAESVHVRPAADFDTPKLRMVKRCPVDKAFAAQMLIVVLQQLNFILGGAPTHLIFRRMFDSRRQFGIPEFGGKSDDAHFVIRPLHERACARFAGIGREFFINRNGGIARDFRPHRADGLIHRQIITRQSAVGRDQRRSQVQSAVRVIALHPGDVGMIEKKACCRVGFRLGKRCIPRAVLTLARNPTRRIVAVHVAITRFLDFDGHAVPIATYFAFAVHAIIRPIVHFAGFA